MRTKRLIALAGVVALSLSGCATHMVRTARPNPEGEARVETSTAFALDPTPKRYSADCPTNLLQDVTIRKNVGQTLLSLLTLGLFDSVTISYNCANVPVEPGSTDD
jgi:hypothetical protein